MAERGVNDDFCKKNFYNPRKNCRQMHKTIGVMDANYDTPLHIAARTGNIDLIERILSLYNSPRLNGDIAIPLSFKNVSRQTPFDCLNQYYETISNQTFPEKLKDANNPVVAFKELVSLVKCAQSNVDRISNKKCTCFSLAH